MRNLTAVPLISEDHFKLIGESLCCLCRVPAHADLGVRCLTSLSSSLELLLVEPDVTVSDPTGCVTHAERLMVTLSVVAKSFAGGPSTLFHFWQRHVKMPVGDAEHLLLRCGPHLAASGSFSFPQSDAPVISQEIFSTELASVFCLLFGLFGRKFRWCIARVTVSMLSMRGFVATCFNQVAAYPPRPLQPWPYLSPMSRARMVILQ